jgi:DNA polymerase III delta subunit
MTEFYAQNIFGDDVNVDLQESDEVIAKPVGKKDSFNIFILTDAIGARNKKNAWILYQKALASGMVADDIFWRAIAWEIKTLLLASKTSSAEESGLNPFVYQKAKAYSKNFKPGELEALSEFLVVGYHNARRGTGDIETLIEKMLLSL